HVHQRHHEFPRVLPGPPRRLVREHLPGRRRPGPLRGDTGAGSLAERSGAQALAGGERPPALAGVPARHHPSDDADRGLRLLATSLATLSSSTVAIFRHSARFPWEPGTYVA